MKSRTTILVFGVIGAAFGQNTCTSVCSSTDSISSDQVQTVQYYSPYFGLGGEALFLDIVSGAAPSDSRCGAAAAFSYSTTNSGSFEFKVPNLNVGEGPVHFRVRSAARVPEQCLSSTLQQIKFSPGQDIDPSHPPTDTNGTATFESPPKNESPNSSSVTGRTLALAIGIPLALIILSILALIVRKRRRSQQETIKSQTDPESGSRTAPELGDVEAFIASRRCSNKNVLSVASMSTMLSDDSLGSEYDDESILRPMREVEASANATGYFATSPTTSTATTTNTTKRHALLGNRTVQSPLGLDPDDMRQPAHSNTHGPRESLGSMRGEL